MSDNDPPQIYKKRYKIDRKLGAGNFGTAYLVTDLKAKHDPKVMKVVRLGEMDEDQTVDSVREAELLSNLDNEHIVKFYESFLENDCLCIVTEFCEGGDLDQRLKELKKQNRTLAEDDVIEWLIQILIAVQYIHKSRVLHRDLKAKNIFLKSNQIKIGDFGISRILVGTMDVATTFTGTPYYMSPEVMKHDGYEAKSDIWSVGCLLYEMCTNQHAFDGKGLMNVIYKVVEGKPPEIPTTYSKELNDLLKKMFMKDPKNRPTATQLLNTPFLIRHRERTHLNGPLENTIAGKVRSKEINSRLQNSMNYGQMQQQSWGLSRKDYAVDEEDEVPARNDSFNDPNSDEEEDEEQLTMKPANVVKSAAQKIREKKQQEADARAQELAEAARSNRIAGQQHRSMMRENTYMGTMREELGSPGHHRDPSPNPFESESMTSIRSGTMNSSFQGSHDDRPITPMRRNYKQIVDEFPEQAESHPARPHKHAQPTHDRSPTRRPQKGDSTLKGTRIMSASQRSATNSMSQTIDPRYEAHARKVPSYAAPSSTLGSATRQRPPARVPNEDASATLKDNPRQDAFGPMAKAYKIDALRTRAIHALGESTFEKVYDYLVQQRTAQKTNDNLDDEKIARGLTAFVKKPADCFLVDQLVFLEMVAD